MKKTILVLVGLFLVSGLYGAGGLDFRLNFGAMSNFDFDDYLWSAGVELDLHLGSNMMLSPEVDLIGYKFEFKDFFLTPGVVFNFKFSKLFIGAGLIRPFLLTDASGLEEIDTWLLKLNAGFLFGNLKLTVYALTSFEDFLTSSGTLIGAKFGFGL